MEEDLQATKAILESKVSDLEELQKKNKKMKEELEKAQAELDKVESESVIKQELAGVKNKMAFMEEDLQATKSILESKVSDLEELQKKNKKMKEELEKAQAELEDSSKSMTTMKKDLDLEKQKKMHAVNKLAEVMNREDMVSANALKKKEKECRRLQAELQTEKEKWGTASYRYQQNITELQASLMEESNRCMDLQMALDSKDSHIEMLDNKLSQLQQHQASIGPLSIADGDDAVHDHRLQGWLSVPNKSNIKREGYWKPQYVIVSMKKILFYDSERDKNDSNPRTVLDLDKLFHVRSVTQAEAMRAKAEDIPKIFQVLYANEGESSRNPVLSVTEENKEGVTSHKGHEFIQIMYHFPTNCEVCMKPMWSMLKPPPAMECQRCRTKCHKEHLEQGLIAPCKVNFGMNSAKDLLIKANTPDERKMWVLSLTKKLPEHPPTQINNFGRNSPRVSSTRYPPARKTSRGAADRSQKQQSKESDSF